MYAFVLVQYLGRWHSYNSAISYALKMPKYRMKAKEIASERGLLDRGKRKKATKVSYLFPYM